MKSLSIWQISILRTEKVDNQAHQHKLELVVFLLMTQAALAILAASHTIQKLPRAQNQQKVIKNNLNKRLIFLQETKNRSTYKLLKNKELEGKRHCFVVKRFFMYNFL